MMPLTYKNIKHAFVPHKTKNTRALLLTNSFLGFYVLLLVLLILSVKFVPILLPGVLGYASDIKISDLLTETNTLRIQKGLNPLVLNDSLSVAAQNKAQDMFANNYWAHVSPQGVKPWEFILQQDYDYLYAGENLAKNFNSSSSVVEGWYNSPSHRENLLSDKYDEIGFAVVNGTLDGYETTLVVQMFGKPKDPDLVAVASPYNTGIYPNDNIASVPLEGENSHLAVNYDQNVLTEYPNSYITVDIDIRTISYLLLSIFLVFILSLLVIDAWYSSRNSIPKINGHTIAHILFLIIILISFWTLVSPGSIL